VRKDTTTHVPPSDDVGGRGDTRGPGRDSHRLIVAVRMEPMRSRMGNTRRNAVVRRRRVSHASEAHVRCGATVLLDLRVLLAIMAPSFFRVY
jgi:hypothetical protein